MTEGTCQPVSVSRRIEAPAEELFEILADPARHPGIDGSGMLKQAGGSSEITGVGDTFTMSMHNAEMGDYEITCHVVEVTPAGPGATIVTEIYDCTRAPEWLRKAVKNGQRWVASMTTTLEKLDQQRARR